MKRTIGMIAWICVMSSYAVWADTPAAEDKAPPAAKDRYLVEMTCRPDDSKAITTTLLTALALREDQSTVVLFIDSQAVLIAKQPGKDQPEEELQRKTDRLFEQVRAAGISVLVCPHCAETHGLTAKTLRAGLRFTTKEELDVERKRADRVYEYREPEPQPKLDPTVTDRRTA